MKRVMIFAIILSLLLSLGACGSDSEEALSQAEAQLEAARDEIAELNERVKEANTALAKDSAKIDELTAELEELGKQRDRFESEKDELESKLAELQKFEKETAAFRTYDIANGKIYYYKHSQLVAVYDNGESKVLHEFVGGLASVDQSPDKTKLLISDFDLEGEFSLYLYDADTDEKKEITITGLEPNHSPSNVCWLDDKYFLFVEQFDHGTSTFGGTVYYYDTETDTFGQVIDVDVRTLQIAAVDMLDRKSLYDYFDATMLDMYLDGDMFLVSAAVVQRGNFVSDKYFVFSRDEIMSCISGGNTILLK